MGDLYGRAAWWLMPRLRRRTRRNLELAYPVWPVTKVEQTARGVTPWIGRAGVDFLQMGRRSPADLLRRACVEGLDHLEAAAALGRGVIATTGHFGNWELLGAWFVARGWALTVLYHPFPEARLDRLVRGIRERVGVRGVSAEGRLYPALRALRRGGVLGILVDRVPRRGGVPDRFFHRDCRTADGAARLAWLAGAPLLPVALWYDGSGYRLQMEPHLLVPGEAAVGPVTCQLTGALERQVRRAPEQWPWFEDRWKMRG